jgi:hypothetical protein
MNASEQSTTNNDLKILSKDKTNTEIKEVMNQSSFRSYSSVVGNNNSNDSNSKSTKIIVKAPPSNENNINNKNPDQEDVVEEIDPFIIERLEDDNDRMFILRLEYEMSNLIKNEKESDIEYPNMNSYQRLIIHKIATHFKLCHINDRNNSSVIVIKTMASRIPKKKFNDIISKPDNSSSSEKVPTGIKIMKRNDKKMNSNDNKKVLITKKKSNDNDMKKKNISLEERKLAYDLARARIFDESNQNSEENTNNSKNKQTKVNKQNIKRTDIDEDDDKDVYNRSNFVIKPQTPDFNNYQYFNQSPNLMNQPQFQPQFQQQSFQMKFQKQINNPKMNINQQLQQNPLLRKDHLLQQNPSNNLLNQNISFTSPFNNSNSHAYSNIRNYSNYSPYGVNNTSNLSSGDNPLMSNPLMSNKNNSNPLNEIYNNNNNNNYQGFTSPQQTSTNGNNPTNFANSPLFQNNNKKMIFNNQMSNNSNWFTNKDFNFKNDYNMFSNKNNFEDKEISSFQSAVYNSSLSSPISSYKKPIGMNNSDINPMETNKSSTAFSKLNPNSEVFIPSSAKNNKLSLNSSPVTNINTPLNINVPEFKPFSTEKSATSNSFSLNKNNSNSIFDSPGQMSSSNSNQRNDFYYGMPANNSQFLNYNSNNPNKPNYF